MWHDGKELWAQFEVPPNSIKMQLPPPPMQMFSIPKFHLFLKNQVLLLVLKAFQRVLTLYLWMAA